MEKEKDIRPNASSDFQLPPECMNVAESFQKLTEGYSSAIDGEIPYNTDGSYSISRELFPSVTSGPLQYKDVEDGIVLLDEKLASIEEIYTYMDTTIMPSDAAKTIYLDALAEYKNKFLMFKESIWLEAEKGGLSLSPEKKNELQKKVSIFHKEIWGDHITEHPEEVKGTWEAFVEKYEENSNMLTNTEKSTYEKFLQHIESKYKLDRKKLSLDKKIQKAMPSHFLDKKLDSRLQEKTFTQMKRISDEINIKKGALVGEERNILVNESSANMAVDQLKRIVKLPGKGTRKLDDVAKKFGHEYGKHVISGKNTNLFLGHGFKGKNYLGTEEGLATLFEAITTGALQIVDDLPSLMKTHNEKTRALLVCEEYGEGDAVEMLRIYKKMGGYDPMSPEARVKRTKRFVPLDIPGASTKDTVYLRGLQEVIEKLMKSTTTREMYETIMQLNQFKMRHSDMYLIEQMKQDYGLDAQEQLLHKTYFTARQLYRVLAGEENEIKEDTLDAYIHEDKVDVASTVTMLEKELID